MVTKQVQKIVAPPCVRIAITGGGRLWMESMAGALGTQDGMEIVAVAPDFAQLQTSVREQLPDVVVTSSRIEGMDDVDQLAALRRFQPNLSFVIIARLDADMPALGRLIKAVPAALLSLEAQISDIVKAVGIINRNCTVISQPLLQQVLVPDSQATRLVNQTFTAREKLVLQRIAEGNSERAIADELHVSVRTVQASLQRAREKLSAVDRAHAVALAMAAKIVTITDGPTVAAGSHP